MPTAPDELDMAILRQLAQSPDLSQRQLARHTGVSLGKLNFALRALIDKGWVKAGNFSRSENKLQYAYWLTPGGVEAKARLTHAFICRKLREYDDLGIEIQRLQREVESEQGNTQPKEALE